MVGGQGKADGEIIVVSFFQPHATLSYPSPLPPNQPSSSASLLPPLHSCYTYKVGFNVKVNKYIACVR